MSTSNKRLLKDENALSGDEQSLVPCTREARHGRGFARPLIYALGIIFLVGLSCWVTYGITKQLILAEVRSQYRDAVDFENRKAPLVELVQTCELSDGDLLRGDSLPESVAKAGVLSVRRRGRFIFFNLVPKSYIPSLDAADAYFVYTLRGSGGEIEDMIKLQSGHERTYHIEYLDSPDWLYWITGYNAEEAGLPG